jgi:hypothetical protein
VGGVRLADMKAADHPAGAADQDQNSVFAVHTALSDAQ